MRITARFATAARANVARRQIAGTLFRYGEPGLTSAGQLRVRPGAIQVPTDLAAVPFVREHEMDTERGHLAVVDDNEERMYVVLQVADGPEGDAALAEAGGPERVRAGLSYYVEDIEVVGDEIVSARLVHIGQVGEPAYNSARIDQIAASRTPGASRTNTQGETMTPEQRARLAELIANQNLTDEERGELDQLTTLAVAEATASDDPPADDAPPADAPPAQAAASLPAVPAGQPRPQARATVRERGTALQRVVRDVTTALQGQRSGTSALPGITAALTDVISTDHTANVEPVAWSGELWSGLEYDPVFSDLLLADSLTNWEGKGWRFVNTPEMADYAGDKTAVPSGTVTTEDSTYTAARMAVGVDIDRKFYDFPNEGFVQGLFERVRESWEIKLDAKVRAFILAQGASVTRSVAVSTTNADATVTAPAGSITADDVGATITGTGIPAATTILSVTNATTFELSANATATGAITASVEVQAPTVMKGAGRIAQALKNTRVGRDPWIVMNDEDMFSLLDVTQDSLPAFLDLWGIKPENFRSSPDVTRGDIFGGVKSAAKLRTLPGSPIRVSAQHLANGGVDEAFFGYWAIEEHHPNGIVKVSYVPAA